MAPPLRSLFFWFWMALSVGTAAGTPLPVMLDAAARSVTLTSQVEALEDPAGDLTLEQVAAAPPEAFRVAAKTGAGINFGYSSSAYWLRFTLEPRAGAPREWLLEIDYPTLDDVRVHAGSITLQAGDRQPFAARPLPHRNFVFPLALAGDVPTTIYLRVASQGSLTVPLRLWTPDAFAHASKNAYAALSVYYGILLALMLYNLLLFASVRDVNFLTYVLFVAGMAIAQLSANGFGNEYLWPDSPAWGNYAFPAGFAATGLFGALFSRGFLKTAVNAPYLDKLMLALAGAFALCLVMPLLSYRGAAILTSLTGAIIAVVTIIAGIRCLQRGHAGARYFLLAWTLLLTGVAVLGTRNLGWLPTNFLTTYAMQIGSALEMLLLSFALADRINTLRREKELAQTKALAAEAAHVATLRDSERQLEQRVAERTQALEKANRTLETHRSQLQEMAHHDALTGLGNRLLLELRLEHALKLSRRNAQPLAVMVVDLDDFKPINDCHGHAIGDSVLIEVAQRLKLAVRTADTVVRLGGDEFVILIEAVNSRADAEQIATKIVDELGQPMWIDGIDLKVSASIGIVLFPEYGHNGRELLQYADMAMYRAKQADNIHYCVYSA